MQGILPNVWHGAQAQNSSAEDFLPKHLSWSKPEDIQQAPQENAPALQPTLALYKELYRRGFSVTFITGRQGPAVCHVCRNCTFIGFQAGRRFMSAARNLAGHPSIAAARRDVTSSVLMSYSVLSMAGGNARYQKAAAWHAAASRSRCRSWP